MGACLSYMGEPSVDKISTDESNDKLVYGASSMQGWRNSQEDAHNSILDYDENTSFFAVYDGHGGHEVAEYCSQNLPKFIKNTEAYKRGDIEQALIDGFLGFDSTIVTPKVKKILKRIAKTFPGKQDSDDENTEDECVEENVNNLYEEALMPIEKVIEKYTSLVTPVLKKMKDGKKTKLSVASTSSSSAEADSNSGDQQPSCSSTDICNDSEAACTSSTKSEPDSSSFSKELNGDDQVAASSNGTIPAETASNPPVSSQTKEADSVECEVSDSKEIKENGVAGNEIIEGGKKDDVSSSVDGEVVSNKVNKGKSPLKKKTPVKNTRPQRNAKQLYQKLFELQGESEEDDDDDDTEDEEDKTFLGPEENTSDEEENAGALGGSDESSEVDDEEEEEEDDEDEEETSEFGPKGPGSDSGCTAVVALLKGKELYVANAGDSRCIVCRNGKAIEMSIDHKPEDPPERARIEKAGGAVTSDGRVNDGLNLSRAIGDHSYKKNQELSDREQMITALPDVKKLTINPREDEFMVLACDGIWNSLTSQEVVDFVRPKLEENLDKISPICEQMFEHCLAPDTMGDGTGCDNMTAIIVKFKNGEKRALSPEPEDGTNPKRAKTDEVQTETVNS
ncbi:hypothetical protein ABEB36_009938 [Hypothenemus hampei]|uniref:protein-serine/threonine phosphatase n=1 Tax=Hypothenemus hampei TaxID=57062 RepID=A0ABD1EI28_HYPHA